MAKKLAIATFGTLVMLALEFTVILVGMTFGNDDVGMLFVMATSAFIGWNYWSFLSLVFVHKAFD